MEMHDDLFFFAVFLLLPKHYRDFLQKVLSFLFQEKRTINLRFLPQKRDLLLSTGVTQKIQRKTRQQNLELIPKLQIEF